MVISFPAAALMRVTQLRWASPLMWTVQAPQRPTPQPNFQPVSWSSSRTYQRSGISGSPSYCLLRFPPNYCILAPGSIVLPYEGARSLEAKIDSENALVRAKAGSRTGFSDLVLEYQSLVFSVAYHFLQNSALAEEIAQDIFLDLYRNIGKIESAAHLTFWLRRSTTNRCIDQSRKLSYRTEVPINDTFHPATAGEVGDTLLSELVRRHVARLPEWQRAIVVLRYQEDLDPAEIAGVLDIPVNTVKSRLHRALGTLRQSLERKHRVRA